MQRNLLDTHTLIWFLNGSKELSEKARNYIEERLTILSKDENFVHYSAKLMW